MAAFAIGTEISGAPRLAAVFYFASWVTWLLVIYSSPLWQKNRKASVAVMSVLLIALFLFWWVLFPGKQPTIDEYADAVWKKAPSPASTGPLMISKYGLTDQAIGAPATVTVYLQNTSDTSIVVRQAYAVGVGPYIHAEEFWQERIKNEDKVFDRAVQYLDDAEKNQRAMRLVIPSGNLHMDIRGDPLSADQLSGLKRGDMPIYFAGVIRHELNGKQHEVTYCGFTETNSKTIPICAKHNERK